MGRRVKFGVLKYTDQNINLGDYVQWEGIRKAYDRMGVRCEDIVEIDRTNFRNYEGSEYVILPMVGYYSGVRNVNEIFPFPDKVIPVYIGFHCVDPLVLERVADEHKAYEPFFCRDLVTMRLMRGYGLRAFVGGCMSLCREKRECSPENGKVFLCDLPEGLLPFIPQTLLDNAETLPSPVRRMPYPDGDDRNAAEAKHLSEYVLDKIKSEAKLVITSRLHVALPSVAMGVPVVLSHKAGEGEVMDVRFSGLDRIIRPYKPSEYERIDWSPKAPDIEGLKQDTLNLAVQRLEEEKNRWQNIFKLSEFYENAEPEIYYAGMHMSYFTDHQKRKFQNRNRDALIERTIFEEIIAKPFEDMELVFWGAGDKCTWAIRRYEAYIKRCRGFYVVDGNPDKIGKSMAEIAKVKKGVCGYGRNVTVQSPQLIDGIDKKRLVIVVAAEAYYKGAGASIGYDLLARGLKEGKDFFFLDKLNHSMEMGLSVTSRPFTYLEGY